MRDLKSVVVYDDLHVFPMREVGEHDLMSGPGGCICEPEMDAVALCGCGHFIKRVIVHNDMGQAIPARFLAGTIAGVSEL